MNDKKEHKVIEGNGIPAAFRIPAKIFLPVFYLQLITGFGQMPIFKRYYIADIPGLGWLDAFHTTLFIHYLGALVLLCLGAYIAVGYFLERRRHFILTRTGVVRGLLLGGAMGTGILLAVKNPGWFLFPPKIIVALNLLHLGLVMVLLLSGGYARIFRKRLVAAT